MMSDMPKNPQFGFGALDRKANIGGPNATVESAVASEMAELRSGSDKDNDADEGSLP